MPEQKSPLPQIIRQLRDVLAETRYAMMGDVAPLVEQAFVLLGFEDQNTPQTGLHASDLAFNVAVILEHTQDNSVIRLCLGMLLRLGGMGELLAAGYLRKNKLPVDTLVATLEGFAPKYKLSLANRFFRHPYKHEPWFLQWAHDLARKTQGEDPEEVLLFLEDMPATEAKLANPLQRELLRGRFGVWLQRLLHLDLDEDQLLFMLRTTRRLGSHMVAQSLARSLGRTQGQLTAGVLETIGACGRKQDPKLLEAVLPYVRSQDDEVTLAALRALAELRSEKLPQALAYVFMRRSDLWEALLPLLLRVDAVGLRVFIERLPQVERLDLLPRLVALFAAYNPQWMQEALRREADMAGKKGQEWRQLVQAMQEFLQAHAPLPREAGFVPLPARKTPGHSGAAPQYSQESKTQAIFDRVKRTVAGKTQPTQEGGRRSPEGLRAILEKGGDISRLTLDGDRLASARFGKARFSRCTMNSCSFSGGSLHSVTFEKCTLRNVDFDGATLQAVTFLDCELSNCRLAGSRLEKVSFKHCRMFAGQLSLCLLRNVSFVHCKLLECDFSGSKLQGLQARSCLVHCGHFLHTEAVEPVLQGVEFSDCRFYKSIMDMGVVRNSVASTSSFADCCFYDLDTDEPGFVSQERDTFIEGMAAAAGKVKPAKRAPQLGSAAGVRLMFRLIEQWFFEKDLKQREAVFLANNRRRLDWALCMLPQPADAFLRMLPAVLESPGPLPLSKGENPQEPVCAIHGYVPDFSTRQMLAQYKIPPGPEGAMRNTALPIQGLYTIGSTGTIAHARFSDIDLWVCYDPADLPPESVEILQDKLSRIEAWAEQAFAVEVHFFLMDLQSVRHNEFGFTDKESAGSSQAQLLKEEFYRTGVYLAGKKPFWWYLPVGVDEAGYRRHLQRFRSAVGPLDRSVLDLGHLDAIPRGEFFGASLWQIVKAIKSPFKSAMKLALLDKYTQGQGAGELLCNRVKHNLFVGGRDLWDIDPYALMFRQVFEFYSEQGNTEAQDLMRMAFLQKTGLYLAAQGTGRFYELQDYSYMEYFFPYSEADIASHVEPGRGVPTEEIKVADTYMELVEVGQKMVRFMLTTYEAIHKLWEQADLDMRVTEQDMTKLGRKVFSYLNPKPHKIMRIPFMDAGKGLFASLEFASQGAAGKPGMWVVSGEGPKRKGRRSRKEELRRTKQLEPLLVWLVANGVYTPNTPLQGVTLEYPISLADISDLLQQLHEFFPQAQVFDTDINEYLNEEQVVRAFVIANFLQPREEKQVRAATIVCSTNWGELFCFSARKDFKQLYQRPLPFLRTNLELSVSSGVVLQAYLPPRSQCPPIRFF